jgi:hypothetical protein
MGSPKRKMHLNHDRTLTRSDFGEPFERWENADLDLTTEAFVCGISKAENAFKP